MRNNRKHLLIAALLAVAPVFSAYGKEATDLRDPEIERKTMQISEELRCLVCQNQTIAESNAELALDLRQQVREMVAAGKGREEVVSYMEQRYGDFVRYRPAFKSTTALLWLGPGILFVVGLATLYFNILKKKTTDTSTPLSEDEKQRVAALLNEGSDAGDKKA